MTSRPSGPSVANAVARDKRGIGFGGAAYAKGIKFAALQADPARPAILPDEKHILDGTYPVSRDLYYYLRGDPAGPIKDFIDFALSPEGQAIVAKVGFYPIAGKKK